MRLIRQYPFLSYAAFSVLFLLAVALLERAGSGYDDGGIGGVAFLLSMLWSVIAFPFYLSSELLFSLNDGKGVPGHMFIALAAGTTLCMLAEIGLHKWRRWRSGAA
ncbi:hypothetical protein [Lysobacter solisilvae (ex Woo and Kim 2020)]|uniref:Uncharacterized protein n=1 Tax=Agrilutibacter terrestris TaxID=2865112 RepID=A0A7H0FVZ7_9GAMM|nr:hypothetical protein [Lysobacter terrestris]QNP40213.1 hypothetical protein H8B22_12050 [Lysobacter terrestris]